MDIFYRCSFKSSGGYKLAKYDCGSHALTYIDERDGEDQRGISRIVRSTLFQGLGRSMVLATDERGDFFLGIYNLVEGDYDKYVNAVFVDRDSAKIIRLFGLFCCQYRKANKALQNTVKRMPPNEEGLEFCIEGEKIDRLLSNIDAMEEVKTPKPESSRLYAFVTEDKDSDYRERLAQRCALCVKNALFVGNIAHDQEKLDIKVSRIYFRNSMRYVIIAGAIIIILLIILLFAWRKRAGNFAEANNDAVKETISAEQQVNTNGFTAAEKDEIKDPSAAHPAACETVAVSDGRPGAKPVSKKRML